MVRHEVKSTKDSYICTVLDDDRQFLKQEKFLKQEGCLVINISYSTRLLTHTVIII